MSYSIKCPICNMWTEEPVNPYDKVLVCHSCFLEKTKVLEPLKLQGYTMEMMRKIFGKPVKDKKKETKSFF